MHYYASKDWLPCTEAHGHVFDLLLRNGGRLDGMARDRAMWPDVAAWRRCQPYHNTVPTVRVRAERGGASDATIDA